MQGVQAVLWGVQEAKTEEWAQRGNEPGWFMGAWVNSVQGIYKGCKP